MPLILSSSPLAVSFLCQKFTTPATHIAFRLLPSNYHVDMTKGKKTFGTPVIVLDQGVGEKGKERGLRICPVIGGALAFQEAGTITANRTFVALLAQK